MKRKELAPSEDPIYRASSSSTSPHVGDNEGGTKRPKENNYEVFLSFRGKDTRKGFTDYLYTSLVDEGIHVFRDDNELHVGEEIGPELLYSIMQSKISIPIISENYAFSKWCLHELAQMLKCRRSRGQVVWPIFYKVEPSQVRHLGDAINAHKENLDDLDVKEWEEALKKVSYLKGWESEKFDNGYEGALVKTVVEKVKGELKRPFQVIVPKELVGIHNHIEEIMSFLNANFNDTRIIGIYGMGGIGKTTLAKVLYNNLSCHFKHLSFVTDIRETSLRKGIECSQRQLIDNILGSPKNVYNVDEGIHIIKSQFTSKKVLVLLDDMDNKAHLNALAGGSSWFKVGSIVIITTRNKSIFDKARAVYMYKLNELPLDPSLILFSRHAFEKDSPDSDYEDISRNIVSTAGGLPLALEVIGSFLHGKGNNIWKETLKKLKKMPFEEVRDKLMISYESLDNATKQIFLDIACFCIGSSKQSVTYMWDVCGFFLEIGIEVLSLRSLIKIDQYGDLRMHDQLRDLGREIVRLEAKKPHKRSRLWNCEEAVDVLDNKKGTSKIEALCLNYYRGKSCRGEQFNKLTNLRFLQVDGVNFTGDFQNLLPQLRWLQWRRCPSDFEVVNFHPKKLVMLDLSYSDITEDWGGWDPLKMATELKVLNLSCCKHLRRTPDLSTFKSLEILILEGCWCLEEIHRSILYIKSLMSLNVNGCERLMELPARVGRMEESSKFLINDTAIKENHISRGCLTKPKTLEALSCDKFAQLPESIGSLVSLTQLELRGTGIEELTESIGSMEALETLDASFCRSLARIPSSIGNLASLSRLDLTRCRSFREIPDSIGKLASLNELRLAYTSITKLPESIGNLQNLRVLDIEGTLVTELPSAIGMLVKLQVLSAIHCKNLKGLPNNIGELVSLNKLHLDRSGILGLPESISKLSSLQNLSVEWCENLRGIPEPPSSLTALHISFPSPSLPYLSKLTLLKELTLFDRRPLECLPELPIRLSKLTLLKELTQLDLSEPTINTLYETGIEELPEFIGSMEALETLDATFCESLARIPSSIGNLASLSHLKLYGCRSLREIPDSIGKLALLTELGLTGTSITKLPESIGNLQNLRILSIVETLVTKLPSAIGMLAKLQELFAQGCKYLEGLPSNIDKLVSLNGLYLGGSGILGLPDSISKLSSLQVLSVGWCENLGGIPEPPSSLTALDVNFPSASLPFLSKLTVLEELSLFDCRPLECLPELPVRLSKVSLPSVEMEGSLFGEVNRLEEKRLCELIRDKSFGRRKVARRRQPAWVGACVEYYIE